MNSSRVNFRLLIILLSILIPVIVGILYYLPKDFEIGEEVYYLPALNAIINSITSVVLIVAYLAIRSQKISLHRSLMVSALILSVLFLLSYVTFHSLTESTAFGGEGWIKNLYYFILISHIILAIAIVPLVLITFSRALAARYDKHKMIARFTLPLWLYVTLSGVVVYLMISPYY